MSYFSRLKAQSDEAVCSARDCKKDIPIVELTKNLRMKIGRGWGTLICKDIRCGDLPYDFEYASSKDEYLAVWDYRSKFAISKIHMGNFLLYFQKVTPEKTKECPLCDKQLMHNFSGTIDFGPNDKIIGQANIAGRAATYWLSEINKTSSQQSSVQLNVGMNQCNITVAGRICYYLSDSRTGEYIIITGVWDASDRDMPDLTQPAEELWNRLDIQYTVRQLQKIYEEKPE